MLFNQDIFIRNVVNNNNYRTDRKQPTNLLKYKDKISKYISSISKELNKKHISGPDMKALLYLIRTLLLSSTENKSDNLLILPNSSINNWLTSLNKLPVKSVGGWVYIANIFNTSFEIIIKTPKDAITDLPDILREYAIANIEINKLRYIIPTFMYTFDFFMCNPPDEDTGFLNIDDICDDSKTPKSIYIMTEKIEGDTISDLIKNNKVDFNSWLFIFLQILLSLEISQRQLEFTHFDLHNGNVIVQTSKTISYDVNIDESMYSIENSNLSPVIIDFGLSTVNLKGKTVGSTDFPQYGMLNFMVQGFDMYKFLCFSADNAYRAKNMALFNSIIDIFNFYDKDDTLNIVKTKENGIRKTLKTYCMEGSYTNIAKYTPLMLFHWVYNKYRNSNPYIRNNINILNRTNFVNISYSNYLKDYNDFFGEISTGVEEATKLIEKCIKNKSYILSKYNINVLSKLNIQLKSSKLQGYIKSKEDIIQNKDIKSIFIKKDKETLENVFNIKIPNQAELDIVLNECLSINIRHNNSKDKYDIYEKLNLLTQYKTDMELYLQLYYTIIELKLEDKFKTWLNKFVKSDIFSFYNKNNVKVLQSKRWSITLFKSIKE
jgi:hypothetical protein